MHVPVNRKGAQIALIGNPNVGKSVVFGFLTGRHATVSNYPGTTVEILRGSFVVKDRPTTLVDTPGINSLVPMSEDEEVVRNFLLQEKFEGVIQVADAKNLRRALLISVQLAEMGLPFVLALNMEDESASLGIEIDKEKLSSLLGSPVIGTVAIQKKGLKELQKSCACLTPSSITLSYSSDIEEAIKKIEGLLLESPLTKRSVALMVLSGDKSLTEYLNRTLSPVAIETLNQACSALSQRYSEPLAYIINRQRLRRVDEWVAAVMQKESFAKEGWLERFGRWAVHPFWGIFIMMGVLFFFYEFVGVFGAQTAVEWLEKGLFGKYLNPFATLLFSKIFFFSSFLRDLFVGEYGIITMALTYALAIIFPIVLTFFIAFSLLEDSGYLPRLAIMLNRLFRLMGLNGKAVVPMVLGLGCDTMATMTTRIMDTKKEKIIITLLLALGVPCSAQLGIILGMLGVLPYWATLVWFGVVVASLLAVGFLSARILPGQRADFILEIPPIRKPTLTNILSKTIARLEWYLKEVVPLFIIGTLALFFLDKLNLLIKIQDLADPLVQKLLHLPPQATEAFLIGFLRRDYGATRFFDLFNQGKIDAVQTTVSLVVITLFVPCLANALMIVKERGAKIATAMVAFIYPFAFLVGAIVNWGLRL